MRGMILAANGDKTVQGSGATSSYERSELWHFNVLFKFMLEEIEPCGFTTEQAEIVLFDCGANRGIWSQAFFETYKDKKIQAHLFEPSSRNTEEIVKLQAAFWAQPAHHLSHVNTLGVSNEGGEGMLYADGEGSFQASLGESVVENPRHMETVRLTTIDKYVADKAIQRIDFLKLDVEGWEFHALQGAGETLRNGKVSMIFFEFSVANVMTRTFFRDFWDFLKPLGYDFFYLDRTRHKLLPITAYENGRWEKFWGTHYFVCRHREYLHRPGSLCVTLTCEGHANQRSGGARAVLRRIDLPGSPDYSQATSFVADGWDLEEDRWTCAAHGQLQCWLPAGPVRLVLQKGPDCGVVEIDCQGSRKTIDLFATKPGAINVYVVKEGKIIF